MQSINVEPTQPIKTTQSKQKLTNAQTTIFQAIDPGCRKIDKALKLKIILFGKTIGFNSLARFGTEMNPLRGQRSEQSLHTPPTICLAGQ